MDLSIANLISWLVPSIREGAVKGVGVDSRTIGAGECFVALGGQQTDGHRFLQEVANRKAQHAVVAQNYEGPSFGLTLHRVPDTLVALQECAAFRFRELTATVVAITGSYGKTTTKHFAHTLISAHCRTWSTPGNQNSQIGLPLSILNLAGNPEVVLLEMAMTSAGHIERLVRLFPPDLAVITAVGLSHAENFSSLEGIARAKGEVLSSPRTRKAILASGLPSPLDRVVFFPTATFSLAQPMATYFVSSESEIYEKGVAVGSLKWELAARHHRHNFLAAAAVAREIGLSWDQILSTVAQLSAVPGRYSIRQMGRYTVVDDCYNASEASVCAALDHLPLPSQSGRRIAVLAEMPELGSFSEECHRRVARHALKTVDLLLCIGEKTRPMADLWLDAGRGAGWYADAFDACRALMRLVIPGDVVLVKGARRARLETLINRLRPL